MERGSGGEVTFILLAAINYVVSQCTYRLYLYLYRIAGVHGADAAGGAGGDDIPRQQRHYMGDKAYQFWYGIDKVTGVAALL